MKQKLPHEGASDTAVLIPTEPLEWLRWQGNQFGSDPMYDRCAAEIDRQRAVLKLLLECDPYEPVGGSWPEIKAALGIPEQHMPEAKT